MEREREVATPPALAEGASALVSLALPSALGHSYWNPSAAPVEALLMIVAPATG